MKGRILGALGALACMVAPALAKDFKIPFGGEGKFYGQINSGYLSYDDGQDSRGEIVDNNISNSRVGVTLTWKLQGKSTLKFNIESGLGFRQSNALSQTSDLDFWRFRKPDFRKLEFAYTNKFGVFSIGQGSMTSDNLTEYDLSGSASGANSDYQATSGGFAFVRADGTSSNLRVRSVFPTLDGTRRLRVRYDTPEFKHFSLGFAYGTEVLTFGNDNIYYDGSLRYTNTVGGVKINGGVGYAVVNLQHGGITRQVVGSVSALHEATGLSATVAAATVRNGGDYVYIKLGWTGDVIDAGKSSVGVEYYHSNDLGFANGSGDSWGLVAVQKVDKINTEFFASYREYSVNQPGQSFRDSNAIYLGGRWKF